MEEILVELKLLGADKTAANIEFADDKEYVNAIRDFFFSQDFMRLGQSVNRAQWQAASMKAMKMSARAKEIGCVGIEKTMTGIRQNINTKNKEQVLQLLALLTQKRVKIITFFQNKRDI